MTQRTEPGRVLAGRYRLVRELGTGGFGRVWQAHDEQLRTDVAVKEMRLPPATSAREHAERVARAEREARNAAMLRGHPNIVAVYDVLTVDDTPWIVMDLVRGCSLQQRITERGRLTVDATATVAAALLDGLSTAHVAGITHRDIKPANVLLADDGRVLLTDFGIAEHHADTALTATGTIVGSVEYIAPERLDGKAAGPAGDLFSLGATLYHAVEGSSAFGRGTPTATITAVLLRAPPPLAHAGRLTTLITRLLDKNPDTRPDIAEARRLLDAPDTGKAPTNATTKSITTTARQTTGRAPKVASPTINRRNSIGGALILVALGVLGIIFVPKLLHSLGLPDGCAQVRTAWQNNNQQVRSNGGNPSGIAANYQRLGDDLDAAARQATDSSVRSVIQDDADASHAVADDINRLDTNPAAASANYNRDIAKQTTAQNNLIKICEHIG